MVLLLHIYRSASMTLVSWTRQHKRFSPSKTFLLPCKEQPRTVLGVSSNIKRFESSVEVQRRFFSAKSSASGSDGETGDGEKFVRLSKRMSELDICSRREADRLISDGVVQFDGRGIQLGEKVPWNATADRIKIRSSSVVENAKRIDQSPAAATTPHLVDWTGAIDAVVLNKPLQYVSGQAEHGNIPAIRLLTRENLWRRSSTTSETDLRGSTVPKSWTGFAPAGRLDLDSTGLLIFTKNGVLAKKIISSESRVEKEYIVDVTPASQVSRRELTIDPSFELPKTTLNLTPLLMGGHTLLEFDKRNNPPIKPCRQAEWIIPKERLRIVLTEGKKHHVRRICREVVGWHVTGLKRVRIGPVTLDDLPIGCWRPLRQDEVDKFLALQS
jgi:23S rRNA pseudouridine2604 synthase